MKSPKGLTFDHPTQHRAEEDKRKEIGIVKLKDFEKLTPGAEVIIKNRRAKLEGNPQIGSGHYYPGSKDYGWAYFRYVDTGRRVTKRNRQVELVQEKTTENGI